MKLLEDHAFSSFSRDFFKRSGIVMEFADDAREMAKTLAVEKGVTIRALLDESFKDFEHGLKLVGRDSFKVTKAVLSDPKGWLDKLVKKSYQKRVG